MRHRRRDPRAPLPFNRARVAVVRQGRSARGGAMNSLHVPVRVPLCEFVCVLYYSMTMAARSGVARDDDVLHLVTVSCEAGFPFVLWLSLIPRARPAPAHRPTHPRERGGRLARTMNVDEITGELQHAIREALEHARSCTVVVRAASCAYHPTDSCRTAQVTQRRPRTSSPPWPSRRWAASSTRTPWRRYRRRRRPWPVCRRRSAPVPYASTSTGASTSCTAGTTTPCARPKSGAGRSEPPDRRLTARCCAADAGPRARCRRPQRRGDHEAEGAAGHERRRAPGGGARL